jgi:hypothetical protein
MRDPLQGLIDKPTLISELRRGFRASSLQEALEILNRSSSSSSPRCPERSPSTSTTSERDEK